MDNVFTYEKRGKNPKEKPHMEIRFLWTRKGRTKTFRNNRRGVEKPAKGRREKCGKGIFRKKKEGRKKVEKQGGEKGSFEKKRMKFYPWRKFDLLQLD